MKIKSKTRRSVRLKYQFGKATRRCLAEFNRKTGVAEVSMSDGKALLKAYPDLKEAYVKRGAK